MKYKTITIEGKQIREHRHIMQIHLGRKLSSDEIVHHKDKNGLNNNISNLELMTRSEHMKEYCNDGSVVGRIYVEKYNYDKKEISKLYIDEYKSVPTISKILNIPKNSLYYYMTKNNIKRDKNDKFCDCGEKATYLKKTICKKCYLRNYHAKRKN